MNVKKLFSILLCVCLLFSTLSTTLVSADGFNPSTVAQVNGQGSAALTTSGALDENGNYSYVYVKFTPNVNSTYKIYSQSSYINPEATLYDSNGEFLTNADDELENLNFQMYYDFEAGKTYYLAVKDYNGKRTFTVFFEELGGYVNWIGKVFDSGNLKYEVVSETEVSVVGYAEGVASSATLEIPSIVNEMTVASIGNWAFSGGEFKTVTIPETITSIGGYAFSNCSALASITLATSVTSIGEYAFENTAYYNNKSNWENDVLYIGDCVIIAKSTTHDWVYNETTGQWQEVHTPGISGSYTIKEGTRVIADYAFFNCEELENITIPKTVTNIGVSAFAYSGYYCNESNWENNVLYIDDCLIKARGDHWDEEYINLLPGVSGTYEIKQDTRVIADYAFGYCEKLQSVTIPKSVTNIGQNSFVDCESMVKISVLNGGAVIGKNAFDCNSKDFVLFGYEDSTAQKFAEENNIVFLRLSHTHNYTEVVTKQPTCTEDGLKTLTCEYGCTNTETIPAIGHKGEVVAGKAATCVETGLTDGKKCTVCGVVILAQKELPTIAHKEEVVVGKAATCTQPGLTDGKKCANCDTVLVAQEEIPALGHTVTVVNKTDATYFEYGYTGDKVCEVCKEQLITGDVVAKLTLKTPKFKLIKGKKQFKVKYTKVAGATGFQVRYKLKGKWIVKTFKSKKTATKAIKKLKKGTYKVQVRAMIQNGKQKAYSTWSKTSKVKVK